MKKRILSIALTILLMNTSCSFAATTQIPVTQNGACIRINEEILDVNNFNYNGTLYIPLRAVSEGLGQKVNWNQDYQTAVILTTTENKVNLLKGCVDVLSYSYLVQNVLNNYSNISAADITNMRILVQNGYNEYVSTNKEISNWDDRFAETYNSTEAYYKGLVQIMETFEQGKSKSIKEINANAKSECNKLLNEIFTKINTISNNCQAIQ